MTSQQAEEKDNELTDETTDQTRETYDLLISAEQEEKQEVQDDDATEDLARDEVFDTQHGEGHTYNPYLAQDQGLTYTPPSDPPILSSDDPQGAEIAAGFAPSMEDANPDAEILPSRVDNKDLDLLDDIYLTLRTNSETGHLANIKAQVKDGVVTLLGTVPAEEDIGRAYAIVVELDGVDEVRNYLQVKV